MTNNTVPTFYSGDIIIDGIPEKSDKAIRVMSYNLRYCDDKAGSVKDRSEITVAIINQYLPDSVGVQDATGEWMKILTANLERYAFVGENRDEDEGSEHNTVFYLRDKYELLDSGTIWLSDTPEVKYTKYEQSNCTRIATWVTLKSRETGSIHTHINTHLDHMSDSARIMQTKVLKKKIDELQRSGAVICTGDFNSEPISETYRSMLQTVKDAKHLAERSDEGITFHNYGEIRDDAAGPIDYVFVTDTVRAEEYKIIRNKVNGMYPSDHYPIMADLIL